MSGDKFIQSKLRPGFFALAAGVCLLVALQNVQGQEALRISMAGDLAAAARQQAGSSIGYYNLLLGPTAWRFSAGLALEYNDNVRLQQTSQGDEGDFILRPNLNAQMHWPVTLKNSLDVSLGAGYSQYLQHQDLNQFFISPGSGLSFDVYVGDFKINLHDRISISQNAYENTGVSGQNRNLVSLQNTLGTSAQWDLNKAMAILGYDHVNYISLSSGQQQPDAESENIYVNGGVRVRPELLLGLEAGGTVINYQQSSSSNSLVTPSAIQWSAGVFGSSQISDYMSVRLDAGYTVYTPDSTATNLVTSESAGFYFSFSLSHRVNRFVNYTLTAGRSTDFSAYGQGQSYYFVRLTPNWKLFEKYAISTPVWWQRGTQVNNTTAGSDADYDQIGLGLNVSRSLTKKLSVGFSYQFVEESSAVSSYNYTDNIVSLNFTYQF